MGYGTKRRSSRPKDRGFEEMVFGGGWNPLYILQTVLPLGHSVKERKLGVKWSDADDLQKAHTRVSKH